MQNRARGMPNSAPRTAPRAMTRIRWIAATTAVAGLLTGWAGIQATERPPSPPHSVTTHDAPGAKMTDTNPPQPAQAKVTVSSNQGAGQDTDSPPQPAG